MYLYKDTALMKPFKHSANDRSLSVYIPFQFFSIKGIEAGVSEFAFLNAQDKSAQF